MEDLNQIQCEYVAGGDGHFRVVVYAPVPHDCAFFVANLYEQVLVGKLTQKQFYNSLRASSYSRQNLETALAGMEVIHWP